MRYVPAVLALTLAVSLQAAAAADASADARAGAARPRIGLVLGGGGAKGAAHIGVIKVLEELRIPIDCIAGTSMGSIVGAAYATGLTADELQRVITAVNWKDILSSAARVDVPVHRKDRDFLFTNGLEFGLKDGRVEAPGGLVPTQQIEGMFRRIVAGAAHVPSFDRLPIPFRAVATDLETGEMVVFDRGELAVAMRASMAVPGAFAPVEDQGRLLVDGMLVRNVPVDVARKTCADVVIAVPVMNPRVTRDKLGSFLGVAGQAMNIAIEANENVQLASLTDKDVEVKVVLKDIGSSDFSKVPEAIPIGEAAARATAQSLSRYSLSPQAYAEWRAHLRKLAELPKAKIDEVRVAGTQVTNPEVAKAQLEAKPGDRYDPDKSDADASRLVARGDFTAASYGVAATGGSEVLTYHVVEKPWGPDYLLFDLNLSTDFKGDTGWGVRADYNKRWLNALGGELRLSGQLGRPNALAAQFYQPLDVRQQFFVAPYAYGWQNLQYLYSGDTAVAQYSSRRVAAGVDMGAALASWGEVRLGLARGNYNASSKVGDPDIPDPGSHALGALTARFTYDTLDKRLFATRGSRGSLMGYFSNSGLGAERTYQVVSGDWSSTWARPRHVWQVALRGGTDLNSNVPFYDQFREGGLFNFSGYREGQLIGRQFALAEVQYRHLATFINETLGTAVYSGFSLELGNVYNRLDGSPASGAMKAGSLYFAVDSKIGPVWLAYGRAQGGHSALYFYLGSSLETYRP